MKMPPVFLERWQQFAEAYNRRFPNGPAMPAAPTQHANAAVNELAEWRARYEGRAFTPVVVESTVAVGPVTYDDGVPARAGAPRKDDDHAKRTTPRRSGARSR